MGNDLETTLKNRLNKALNDRVFPGASLGIVFKNGTRILVSAGYTTDWNGASEVTADTIYDVASVTKFIATACSVLVLIDRGELCLDSRVFLHLPGFDEQAQKREIRIKHLLTNTVDLDLSGPSSDLKDLPPHMIIERIKKAPVRSCPGEVFAYSNALAIIMGLLIKNATELQLDSFAEREFFKSLGMKRTSFMPIDNYARYEIAPTQHDALWRKELVWGKPHDEVTYALQEGGYFLGAAGLFSTVSDLLVFIEMMLCGGELANRRYLNAATVRSIYENQLTHLGLFHGLGCDLNQEWMGELRMPSTFGKTGFTGCSIICDPWRGLGIVLLSNRTFFGRPENADVINAVRRDISDIVFRSVDQG